MERRGSVHSVDLFEGVPEKTRERAFRNAYVRIFSHREMIWMADASELASFAFLKEGCVKLVKTHASGRETILHLAGRGELLCSSSVFLGEVACCSAVVVSDRAIVLTVPRRDLIDAIGDVGSALMTATSRRNVTLCSRVEEVASGRVERRLAKLLLRLADQIGEETSDGLFVPVVLSRQDLADLTATTVETAIRMMRKLEKAEVIRTEKTGFWISSRVGLLSATDRPSLPISPED